LQAEENLRSRARSTRGGNTKKRAPVVKKKKEKKKSSNKVKDEDDSDIGSGSGSEKKSPKRTGGFHVGSILSD
jgi:upstream activation factor subunit UAF30